MKIIEIALKDLTRSFRSAFALVFMFVVPLLVTGMFYFMFGNQQPESAEALDFGGLVELRAPQGSQPANSGLGAMVGGIMGGMLIFFAFYTGTASAQSILTEDEEGTLARLFTTPTPQTAILAGKFLAVFLTVLVQVVVVLVAARLLFQVEWGRLAALAALGIVVPATAFGIFFNALLRGTRQGSALYGGVLTVTGMAGMLPIFSGGGPIGPALQTVSLCVPQGWALRGLQQAMNGESAALLLPTLLVCLAWGLVFFTVGAWRFQKRFA